VLRVQLEFARGNSSAPLLSLPVFSHLGKGASFASAALLVLARMHVYPRVPNSPAAEMLLPGAAQQL